MNEDNYKAEFKFNLGFFGAAISRTFHLKKKKEPSPLDIVAHRFVQIFQDHGVSISQIPRFIPVITLEKLNNHEALLSALTTDVLEQTADLFQVRREWLEGLGFQIYQRHWCYKQPEAFFKDLSAINIKDTFWQITILSKKDTLDYRSRWDQPIVLVLVEKIANIGEKEINRYRIYGDGWDWGYWKCRIQLKAMARLAHERYEKTIPIYTTDPKTLKEIEAGWRVPRPYLIRRSTKAFLEDFGLSPEESAVSKESEELPEVMGYIQAFKLQKNNKNKNTDGTNWRREMFL